MVFVLRGFVFCFGFVFWCGGLGVLSDVSVFCIMVCCVWCCVFCVCWVVVGFIVLVLLVVDFLGVFLIAVVVFVGS